MRGNKPKPLAVQMQNREVHLSKKELKRRLEREQAFMDSNDAIFPPEYLTVQKQKDRFNEITSLMLSVPGFPCTNLDVDAIARYVIEEEDYLIAVKDLRKARKDADMRTIDLSRFHSIKNAAFKCVDSAAKAIGLTVDARLRFDIKKEEEKPPNPFEGL